MSQLSLLLSIPVETPEKPVLSVELVPMTYSLAYGQRYFIGCKQGDHVYAFRPLQFTQVEALALLPELQKFCWRLDDDGIPDAIAAIHDFVEQAMGGAA